MQATTQGTKLLVTLDLNEVTDLRGALAPHPSNTPSDIFYHLFDACLRHEAEQPKTFTVTVEVPAGHAEANVYEAKNHLRKYIADKIGVPKDLVNAWVKEGSAA